MHIRTNELKKIMLIKRYWALQWSQSNWLLSHAHMTSLLPWYDPFYGSPFPQVRQKVWNLWVKKSKKTFVSELSSHNFDLWLFDLIIFMSYLLILYLINSPIYLMGILFSSSLVFSFSLTAGNRLPYLSLMFFPLNIFATENIGTGTPNWLCVQRLYMSLRLVVCWFMS